MDFYCAAAAIVIEVDGAQHYTEQGIAYDQERSRYLESLGLRVVRIPNSYLENRFDETCKWIDAIVQERIRA